MTKLFNSIPFSILFILQLLSIASIQASEGDILSALERVQTFNSSNKNEVKRITALKKAGAHDLRIVRYIMREYKDIDMRLSELIEPLSYLSMDSKKYRVYKSGLGNFDINFSLESMPTLIDINLATEEGVESARKLKKFYTLHLLRYEIYFSLLSRLTNKGKWRRIVSNGDSEVKGLVEKVRSDLFDFGKVKKVKNLRKVVLSIMTKEGVQSDEVSSVLNFYIVNSLTSKKNW